MSSEASRKHAEIRKQNQRDLIGLYVFVGLLGAGLLFVALVGS